MKLLIILFVCLNLFSEPEAYVSPKKGWSDFEEKKTESSILSKILLYIPNRIIDLFDIFKLDVGVGPAYGVNVRVTKYAQAGFRVMAPASLRVGNLGRRFPALLESSNEFGISPFYVNSRDRVICGSEIGVGVDPFLAGIYFGICPTEILDFIGGFFFIDFQKDDLD